MIVLPNGLPSAGLGRCGLRLKTPGRPRWGVGRQTEFGLQVRLPQAILFSIVNKIGTFPGLAANVAEQCHRAGVFCLSRHHRQSRVSQCQTTVRLG